MLGFLRLALAILVSLNHLWMIYGVGRLAVFSFYVISGYLMTAILTETYGVTAQGIKRYAVNRLLRIYPSYLVSFVLFAAVFSLFDRQTLLHFDSNISTPSTIVDWLKNATLMGLDFSAVDRTIPPSWTLFVELFYYALIPILLIASRRLVLLWLLIAAAYHVWIIAGASPTDPSIAWEARYGNIAAGGLGFAIGACARLYLPAALKTRSAFLVCLALFCSCYAFSAYWALTGTRPELQRILSTVGYYGVMISAAPVVDYLARMRRNGLSEKFGEFSYPFYLVHIPVGFLIFHALDAEHKTATTMAAGVLASLLCSWCLVLIDRKISSARASIRQRNTTTEPLAASQ
ncbi:acyltransferase family protein [Pseudomonas sp. CJQ_7]|uniref:acyltransferase family protein n=1 Tax=Pseudomonas sp. CJQ_7 TaxID=3367166 RepID=UPI00370AAAF3